MSSASSSQSKVIVVAFGLVGQSIVDALTSSQYGAHFSVTVLLHSDSVMPSYVDKWKAANLALVDVDVHHASSEELVKLVSGGDIVISTGYRHSDSDLKLLDAVKAAKVQLFIPNMFTSDVLQVERIEIDPVLKLKKSVIKAVQESGVNHILFFNGAFFEYLLSPFFGVDFHQGTITAPGSFTNKITATSVHDVGVLVAEALLPSNRHSVKNQVIHLGGDTVTWNDMHALLEERFKKPLRKQVVSKEELEKQVADDVTASNMPPRFWLLWLEQKGVFWDIDSGFHRDHAKHLHLTKFKEYVLGMQDEGIQHVMDVARWPMLHAIANSFILPPQKNDRNDSE